MKNKRLLLILSIIIILLLIPLIAMQFTNEVNWTGFDFIVAGILLTGTGLVIELVLRKVKSRRMRIIVCLVVLFILFLVWAELAVGII